MNLTTGELVYIATLMDTERNRVAEKCKPEFTKLYRKITRELSEPDMTEAQLAAYAELRDKAEDVLQAWDNDCPGFDVMNKLRAVLGKLEG